MKFWASIVDVLFPPLCFVCNSPLSRLPFVPSKLCSNCWELSQVIDPNGRCIHCFKDCDTSLCGRCAKDPELPYPRAAVFDREAPILRLLDEEGAGAFAGFAYYQWQQLALPDPDFIVSIVPSEMAKAFAMLCNKPNPNLFRRRFCFGHKQRLELREGLIPEDATLLLFDLGCKQQELEDACSVISEAFPKRVSILSLAL
jgi:hypothetical protein